jgi:uncharacterized membrane protein YidH (DUF202 family)
MKETGEVNALFTLMSFLMLPAILLIALGLRNWYNGYQRQDVDKMLLGKMVTMFGVIFAAIVLICSYFLKGSLPG